jgi:Cu-Zn family superoxide dismutase
MRRKLHVALFSLCLAVSLAVAGCCTGTTAPEDHRHHVMNAIAVVTSADNGTVHGTVKFSQKDENVTIVADIQGLPPNTNHGFHIHEFGDISDMANKSVGGHYNPEGRLHGSPESPAHHAGDLGNITADANGVARYELVVNDITIAGRENPILGRSVVIHADTDDMTSQPSGNSGLMIAAGVVGIAGTPAVSK